jgi:hypothetical protein
MRQHWSYVAVFYGPDLCFAEAEKYIPDLQNLEGWIRSSFAYCLREGVLGVGWQVTPPSAAPLTWKRMRVSLSENTALLTRSVERNTAWMHGFYIRVPRKVLVVECQNALDPMHAHCCH